MGEVKIPPLWWTVSLPHPLGPYFAFNYYKIIKPTQIWGPCVFHINTYHSIIYHLLSINLLLFGVPFVMEKSSSYSLSGSVQTWDYSSLCLFVQNMFWQRETIPTGAETQCQEVGGIIRVLTRVWSRMTQCSYFLGLLIVMGWAWDWKVWGHITLLKVISQFKSAGIKRIA